MRILFFGDIMGGLGRAAVKKIIPQYKKRYKPDLILANGENLAHLKGMTPKTVKDVLDSGIDYLTNGNHFFGRKDVVEVVNKKMPIIRPANYPEDTLGQGYAIIKKGKQNILLINLLGRVFLRPTLDCPFRKAEDVLKKTKANLKKNIIIVDFHAEATSEKVAFGHWLDGKVSAVVGTHTHIPTADNKILSKGTAYVTDIGMVGASDSVIGAAKEGIIRSYLTQIPEPLISPQEGRVTINAVLIEIDDKNHLSKKIIRCDEEVLI